jgi:Fe-Mn family superoxide dismutase
MAAQRFCTLTHTPYHPLQDRLILKPPPRPEKSNMAFTLPNLPFAKDALAPHISPETLDYHHGKHHQKYVDTLNDLIEGKPEAEKPLDAIIQSAEGGVFNNAAQVWNHTFYWHSLKPGGGGTPTGPLADAINRDFGGFDAFKTELATAAATQFGLPAGPGSCSTTAS